ncbi:MAG: hypothetical protein R6V05_11410 [Candidatus Brocadiia bacterium]
MGAFLVVAGVIAVLIVIWRIRAAFRKFEAALNCLMAKAAFASANDDLRATAVFRSWRILPKMGFSGPGASFDNMSEVAKCSVLALAFAELNVPPPFENEEWQYVARPFTDILNADTAFATAHRHLKSTYGADIPL